MFSVSPNNIGGKRMSTFSNILTLPKAATYKSRRTRFLSSRVFRWIVWGVAAAFILLQFMLQLSAGVMIHELMHSFTMTAVGASVLSGAYYYIYASLQTPAGILIDRIGARRLLTVGAVVCAVGCAGFALSGNLYLAILARMVMGAGTAFAFIGCMHLIGIWFPTRQFAFMIGMTEMVGMVGILFGNSSIALLSHSMGWRFTIWAAAGMAIVLAVLCWTVIRDKPRVRIKEVTVKPQHSCFREDVKTILCKPATIFNGMYVAIMFAVVTVFVALWGVPYLEIAQHLTVTGAALAASMVFIGVAVGSPVIGWASDNLASRRALLIMGAAVSTVLLSVIIFASHVPLVLMYILLFSLGFFTSTYVLNYAVAKDIAPAHASGTSIGIANTFAVGSAPVLQLAVGWILYLVAQDHTIGGRGVYTLADYQIALSVLPILLFVAIIFAVFIPNTKTDDK